MNPAALFLDSDHGVPVRLTPAGYEVVVLSRRGPGKSVNQDAALVLDLGGSGLVLAVADGMGGHAEGERAARVALEELAGNVTRAVRAGDGLRTGVLDGIEAAQAAVQSFASDAGTTLAVAEVAGNVLRSYHVGDSVVLVTGQRGRLRHLTVDHSPTGYAVEAGLLDPEEAMLHPERHVLLSAVGHPGMRIDVGPEVPLHARDTLLLASDGLTDNLATGEVLELARRGPAHKAVERLAAAAQERMARTADGWPSKPDDLTLVLLRRMP